MTTPQQPTGKEVLLVTIRVDHWQYYIDVTDENESGIQLGPFGGVSEPLGRYMKRIERHILVNWYSWYAILQSGNVMAYDEAVRLLTLDCMTRTQSVEDHEHWMERHPLPAPQVVKI